MDSSSSTFSAFVGTHDPPSELLGIRVFSPGSARIVLVGLLQVYSLRRIVLGRTSPGKLACRSTLELWIFDALAPAAAAAFFQKCSVSSMYFLSITVLVSYRRLYGYLNHTLVELSPQKGTRAERNPAVP